MFSRRLNWDAPSNPLSALLDEKRRAGARVLDLTESNPTRAGLSYPENALLGALADPASLRYNPDPRGLASARVAVSKYYEECGIAVEPSQILLTASTSETYAYLFKLLADPGDEILIPRPSYPLFEFLARLESVSLRQYPLRYDGAWHIDFDSLETAIAGRTKAIVVVNPNNPTGSFVKAEEAERLQTLAARHDLAIISDEVFAEYGFARDANRAATLLTADRALTFCLSGISKIAGLPQMKLGWIAGHGPGHALALQKMEWIADMYLSVGTPIQAALPRILEASKDVRDQIRRRTADNLALVREQTERSPASVLNVEGGWYAVLQVPRVRSEEQWVMSLLRDRDVLVQPGFFYDFESEAFFVLSLLTETQTFREGLKRICSNF